MKLSASHLAYGCFMGVLSLSISGCFPVYETRLKFGTHGIAPEKWERHQQECHYEAAKATASANVNIAGYIAEDLYIKCLELRGAKYQGEVRVRVE